MPQETAFLYGPVMIIAAALAWGLGRIFYLSIRNNVSVLSFIGQRKTAAELGLVIIAIILDGYLLVRPFWPDVDQVVWAQASLNPIFGLLVMGLGVGLMIISQIDMGRAWRIGVPEEREESQNLITGGVYQYSRNPIYVAILMFLTGAAILVPGPLTIASVIFTYLLVGQVIRREEAFLETAFGDEFRHYCQHVRRWL